jgi:hypothetical protein
MFGNCSDLFCKEFFCGVEILIRKTGKLCQNVIFSKQLVCKIAKNSPPQKISVPDGYLENNLNPTENCLLTSYHPSFITRQV